MGERTTGYALVAAGIVFNNYVYLHDLLLYKHAGFIYVGWKSAVGILFSVALVGLGVRVISRES